MLLRRSDSSAECRQQARFACSCARSEKTDSIGSARSRSQTAFPELFPATASVGPPSGPISGSWHICQSALRWPTAGRFFVEGAWRPPVCAVTRACRPRSPCDPKKIELISPVIFQSPYGFRHIRYASLSISTRAVLECDRTGRRSVNIGLPASMKSCEKSFIHGLNRRFTVLNS